LKKIVISIITALIIATLAIALFHYSNNLQSNEKLSIKGEIIQAYVREGNTSIESGIAYSKIISYVFFVNVTNLSDTDLQIRAIRISERDSIINYEEVFGDGPDYIFPKQSSRLIAFDDLNGLSGLSLKAFENAHNLKVTIAASFLNDAQGKAGFLIESDLQLERISSDEFLFGNNLTRGQYFVFGHQPINAWLQEGQMK